MLFPNSRNAKNISINSYSNIAKEYISLGDMDTAKLYINNLESKFPGHEETKNLAKIYESEYLLNLAKEEENNRNYSLAVSLLEEAIRKNPDYENIRLTYDEIIIKQESYLCFLDDTNNIKNLNSEGNYLEAYNKLNMLLDDPDFNSIVSIEEINELSEYKDIIYSNGKDFVSENSIIKFSAYTDDGAIESINNIFGESLYKVWFESMGIASGNTDRYTDYIITIFKDKITIGGSEGDLILYSSENLVNSVTGKSALSESKDDYPDAIVEVAKQGEVYSINKFNRTFIIEVNSVKTSSYWFEELDVFISVK